MSRSPFSWGAMLVIVESPRFPRINIGNLVIESNIYENSTSPSSEADVVIADSANISQATYFIGQERVIVQIYDKTNTNPGHPPSIEPVFTKSFIVTGIERSTKANDSSSVFILKLLDEVSYLNRLSRFSKYYRGKPEEIIQNVLMEQLGAELEYKLPTEQETMQIVNPYTTNPLMCAHWLTHRCTVNEGSPYYLYPIMRERAKFRLKSLDEMLLSPPINQVKKFRYSSTNTAGTEEESFEDRVYQIANMSVFANENMHHLFNRSATSAQYMFLDLTGGFAVEERFKASEILNKRPTPQGTQTLLDYDDDFNVAAGRTVDNGYNSYSSLVVPSAAFKGPESYNSIKSEGSYEDVATEYTDPNYHPGEMRHNFKMFNRALRGLIGKSPIVFEFPGYFFLKHNDTVIGEQIDVQIPKDMPTEGDDTEANTIDYKKSGRYIVYNMRHRFSVEEYSVSCTCVKLHNMNMLEEEAGKINITG